VPDDLTALTLTVADQKGIVLGGEDVHGHRDLETILGQRV
jgi:hypothetical protein